ncbi:MAG: DUF5640 domain-containing protein [Christensenellales bacterium]|jgi:hypothetical protein
MRKNRLAVVAVSAVLVLMLLLSACGGGDELHGTWEGRSEDMAVTWTFDGKGGCKMENEYGIKDDGTYSIDGSNVTIKLSNWEAEIGYQFKLDDKKLSLETDEVYRPSYQLEKK